MSSEFQKVNSQSTLYKHSSNLYNQFEHWVANNVNSILTSSVVKKLV